VDRDKFTLTFIHYEIKSIKHFLNKINSHICNSKLNNYFSNSFTGTVLHLLSKDRTISILIRWRCTAINTATVSELLTVFKWVKTNKFTWRRKDHCAEITHKLSLWKNNKEPQIISIFELTLEYKMHGVISAGRSRVSAILSHHHATAKCTSNSCHVLKKIKSDLLGIINEIFYGQNRLFSLLEHSLYTEYWFPVNRSHGPFE